MDYKQFADLVRRMRTAQKDYFRTRHKSYLDYSKKLEKQVDTALDSLNADPGLFDNLQTQGNENCL